jgi:ribonuclease P protein component
VRNRLKRQLREFCRRNLGRFTPRRDFVLIAKSGAEKLSYAEIVDELGRALAR